MGSLTDRFVTEVFSKEWKASVKWIKKNRGVSLIAIALMIVGGIAIKSTFSGTSGPIKIRNERSPGIQQPTSDIDKGRMTFVSELRSQKFQLKRLISDLETEIKLLDEGKQLTEHPAAFSEAGWIALKTNYPEFIATISQRDREIFESFYIGLRSINRWLDERGECLARGAPNLKEQTKRADQLALDQARRLDGYFELQGDSTTQSKGKGS